MTADPARLEAWFTAQGWTPFSFQREVWSAMGAGRSGLLHATTGSGKKRTPPHQTRSAAERIAARIRG